MSIELEVQENKTGPTEAEILEKGLRQHFEADYLKPGEIHEIPQPRNPNQSIESSPGEPWGVSQELRAVVKAGQDYYFLIDSSSRVLTKYTRRPENINGTFVTKFRPGSTAQLVDFSVERDFEHSTVRPLRAKIDKPGVDIVITQNVEGTVSVVDEGSREFVEVFKQKYPEATKPDGISPETADEKTDSPASLELRGGSAWYLPSSQVTDAMEHTLNGRY